MKEKRNFYKIQGSPLREGVKARSFMNSTHSNGSLILYQTEDGQTQIEVQLIDETVWLTQAQMAELFSKDKRTISEHIQNIFKEGELSADSTVRNFRIVQKGGSREVARQVDHYNLDVIISVGYRVKSHRGTQFRIWATARLKEFLVKGFVLDDERLKRLGGGNYFDELLTRIRDIRSSEKVFWRKVLDIYAISIDYDPNIETSKDFFRIVQNRCIGLLMVIQLLKLSIKEPIAAKNTWDSLLGLEKYKSIRC